METKGLKIYRGSKNGRFTYFVKAKGEKSPIPVNERNICSFLYKKFNKMEKVKKKKSKK